jgi:hypothetical protein
MYLTQRATTRQGRQRGKISAKQRLFLCAAPALDLALGRDRIFYPLERWLEGKDNGTPERSIAIEDTAVVFGDPLFQIPSSRPNVIRAVGTA